MFRPAALMIPFALAACAETSEPDPAPVPNDGGYNMVDPVGAAPDDASTAAEGRWVSGTLAGKPALLFGPADSEAQFSMRCGDGDGLVLSRNGIVPAGGLEMMVVSVEGANARYAVRAPESPLPMLVARVPATDNFLAQLRDAPGEISVRIGDGAPLVMQSDPRVSELVRRCARETPAGT